MNLKEGLSVKLYRIFLPKYYNNSNLIEPKKIRKITEQIQEKFGAYSLNPFARLPIIEGIWTSDTKKVYSDTLYCVELFVEDTFNNQSWLKAFKEMARQELQQEELFVIVQNAEILRG